MRYGNERGFFSNRLEVVSSKTLDGYEVSKVSKQSGKKLLVKCQICSEQNWIKAQSLQRGFFNSWHKSYRCDKCININRPYTHSHKQNIGNGNRGTAHSEERILNIIKSLSAIKESDKNWKHPYKEYVFRSSYEVRLAKILDFLQIDWKYESKTLKMFDGTKPKYYLPDFYLPEFNIFIEVKGWWRDDDRLNKFNLFRTKYNICLVMKKDLIEVENVLWG